MQTGDVYLELVLNLTLLVALSVVSGFLGHRWPPATRKGAVAQGALFGLAAVIGMFRPVILLDGVIFDGRSVMLSMCALFFGPWAGGLAALLTIAARFGIGGIGMTMGVLVILASTGIGLWAHLRLKPLTSPLSSGQLYLLGLVVHLTMGLLMLSLPHAIAVTAWKQMGLPILLVYPLATILVGRILSDQQAAARFVSGLQVINKNLDITLQSIGDAVVATDLQGRIERMNPAAESITGWTAAEARGQPAGKVLTIRHESTRQVIENPVTAVLRSGQAMSPTNHSVLIARNGTERPIANSAAPIRDEVGRVNGAVLVLSDQTAQREARRVLAESEERLRLALNAANQGLYDLNVQTGECTVSPEYARMLGYDPAGFRETNAAWRERLHPEDRETVFRIYEDYVAGRRGDYQVEFRQRTKDGSWRWILSLGKIVARSSDGRPLRMLGTHTDITERKRAEEQLRESEEKLRMIVEHSTQLFYSHTADGILTYVSPQAKELLDWEPSEALLPWTEFLTDHPANGEGINLTREAIETGEAQRPYQLELKSRRGRKVWVEVHESPVVADGRTIAVVGALTDITEKKQREQELRASEARCLRQRNALIAFTAGEALTNGDLAGTIRRLTETSTRTLGVARVSLWRYTPDRSAIECVDLHELEADRHSSGLKLPAAAYPAYFRALAGVDVIAADDAQNDPRTREFTENYLHPLGITSMLDASVHLGGAVEGVLCHEHVGPPRQWTADEKTFAVAVANLASLALEGWERRRAEGQLRLQSSALEAAANAIMITDRVGVIQWVNPAFTKFTGYAMTDAIGRNPGDLLKSGKHDRAFYQSMWKTILDGKVWCGELINRRKDGGLYTEEVTITPSRNSQGEITHFVAVKQDITKRKLLEEQFRQAHKMEALGQLAGGVAHDFNNMLAVIIGNASLIQMGLSESQRLHALQEILRAGERAGNLTRQLLTFSRRQTLQARPLDLNDVVSGMVKMLHRIIGEDIALQTRLLTDSALVHADPGMMEQVLLNLAVNARDAMPLGGEISVTLTRATFDPATTLLSPARPGDFIRLSVSDTGAGIAAEHLPHIFEPFFTTKDVGKGTGLGLATVHGIIEQHHGWIEVDNRPGAGATFHIYLPRLTDPDSFHTSGAEVEHVRGGSETILLAEDEMALRLLATHILKRYGYQVIEAASGVEAIQLWQRHGPTVDLLLTDIVMPDGVSGRQLAEQLRIAKPALKVIYMSGYPGEVAGRGLNLCEGINFLKKPFSPVRLAGAVRDCLDEKMIVAS